MNLGRLGRCLPESVKNIAFISSQPFARLWYMGRARHCPVCGSHLRKLLRHGSGLRPDARCPVCGSLERHRLSWLFLQEQTQLFVPSPVRMLHVAPERVLERKFKKMEHLHYLTADLNNSRAMVQMDITRIQFPENSFDAIYCSHVLEHVEDDRKAMREFYRVLDAGGWAVILVPITAEATVEDSSIVEPAERERVFGQRDHVRRYGPDCEERLREAGFEVAAFSAREVTNGEMVRLGLREDEIIYFCTK